MLALRKEHWALKEHPGVLREAAETAAHSKHPGQGWSRPNMEENTLRRRKPHAKDKVYRDHLRHFVLDVHKEMFVVPVVSVYQSGYSLN